MIPVTNLFNINSSDFSFLSPVDQKKFIQNQYEMVNVINKNKYLAAINITLKEAFLAVIEKNYFTIKDKRNGVSSRLSKIRKCLAILNQYYTDFEYEKIGSKMLLYEFYQNHFKQGIQKYYSCIKQQTKDIHFNDIARGISTILILLNHYNLLSCNDYNFYKLCADCNTDLSSLVIFEKDEQLYCNTPSGYELVTTFKDKINDIKDEY
eukprot:Pgem_evm1s19179